MGRLTGVAVPLVAFLVPFFVNILVFFWFCIRIDHKGGANEGLLSFFTQQIFVLAFAVSTFFVVSSLSKERYKILSFIAFLPIVIFFCLRIYTCLVFEHSSVICKKLPTESIVYSIVLLLISFRLFIQWLIIPSSLRYLEELNDAVESPFRWTYAALLYLFPSLEFFTETAFFPGFKNAKTWFGFFSAILGKLAKNFNLYEVKLVQFIVALYVLVLLMYICVHFQQRHRFQFWWFAVEFVLELFLLLTEQFVLMNPISLVLTVVIFVSKNVCHRSTFDFLEINSADTQQNSNKSLLNMETKL